jgi:hypothetical protein
MNCASFPSGDGHRPCLRFLPLWACGAGVYALMVTASAQPPKIDRIEPFLSDWVQIHIDVEANHTYELQYTETLTTNGVPGGTWTSLGWTSFNLPDFNHYVVIDTKSRAQRFYRLHVLP